MPIAGEKCDLNTPENEVGQNLKFNKMKKVNLIKTVGGLLLASLMVVTTISSCQKEKITPNRTQDSMTEKSFSKDNSVTEKAMSNEKWLKWHDNEKPDGVDGVDYGCWDNGGNCYNAKKSDAKVSKLIDNIGNESESGDTDGVDNIIENNLSLLSEYIPIDDLYDILHGNVTISVRGRIARNGTAYVILSRENRIYSVYPIRG